MKKKAAAFVSAFVSIIIFAASLCFTNARYLSSVTVTETLDCARTAGTISIHAPEGVGGYDAATDSFKFAGSTTQHVHYHITNTTTLNGKEYADDFHTEYYFRIVTETPADEILFTAWSFAPIWTWGAVGASNDFPKDGAIGGYGPFKYVDGAFKVKVGESWNSITEGSYIDAVLNYGSSVGELRGICTLKVQMFCIKGGAEKIIDEADLRIKVSEVIVDNKVNLTLCYRKYGSAEIIGNSSITVEKGKEIDFTSAENLEGLGVELPAGYSFRVNTDVSPNDGTYLISYATSGALGWDGYYKFNITEDLHEQTVDVYLIQDGYIPVDIQYLDRSKQPDGSFEVMKAYSQRTLIKAGDTIDFKDASKLSLQGITLPDTTSYKYIAAHCYGEDWAENSNYYHDIFTARAPADNSVKKVLIDVYVAPLAMRPQVKVYLKYVVSGVVYDVEIEGNEEKAYIKDVVNGFVTFTPAELKTLCPQFASYSSFEIGILNTNGGSMCAVGNPATNGGNPVSIDCFKIYQYDSQITEQVGYCLSNTNMRVYIIAWP